MHHWDRDSSGRLQRVCTPTDQSCEVSVHSENMDPLLEEQQSQQAAPMNPTAYKSIRDYIHPPRVSAPTCIIPPTDNVVVRLMRIKAQRRSMFLPRGDGPFQVLKRIKENAYKLDLPSECGPA